MEGEKRVLNDYYLTLPVDLILETDQVAQCERCGVYLINRKECRHCNGVFIRPIQRISAERPKRFRSYIQQFNQRLKEVRKKTHPMVPVVTVRKPNDYREQSVQEFVNQGGRITQLPSKRRSS